MISNVTLDTRGQVTKRAGQSILHSTGAINLSAVTGGKYHSTASGSDFFAIVVGTGIYRTGNTYNGTYTDITGTVTVTASASNLAQATGVNDYEVFCNESNQPFKVKSSGNATPLATTVFTGAKTCATYGSYLIAANTTESAVSYPSRVRWSDIANTDSFPVLNYVDIEPNDGDKIVSLVTFQDSVYIFKKRTVYRVMITGLDGPDAFIIRPIARNIGAWAKNSVKVVPGQGIFFLAQNTAYKLTDEGLEPIGDPIQRTFDSVTRSMWVNAVAEVYPKRYQYWLSVSTTTDSQNNVVLIYDYVQKAWSTYTGLKTNMLAQAEDSSGNGLLLSGDYTGNNYKQDTTNTTDNLAGVTTNIAFTYATVDLPIGTPEFTKNFKYLYLFFNVAESSSTIEAAFDYSSNYEFSQIVSLGQIGALYDSAIYNTDVYPALSYKVARIDLNRSARAIRLRFTEPSANGFGVIGWALVYDLEDWKM